MRVITSEGYEVDWNTRKIVDELMRDYEFAQSEGRVFDFNIDKAKNIAQKAKRLVERMGEETVTTDVIRGAVAIVCAKEGLNDLADASAIVGIPAREFSEVVTGGADYDNANLQPNAETTHKLVADKTSKKYYLRMMPKNLSLSHLRGDLHIHDLEYFGTRFFCQDWDLRYFLYYGLLPDGTGMKASVAGPAKHANVAISHAVQALGSAQTNFAGGQGYYNFLTFLAPFFENMTYPEIKQHIQSFIYLMAQTMVARGGQAVFSSIQVTPGVPDLWKDRPVVFKGQVWDGRTIVERIPENTEKWKFVCKYKPTGEETFYRFDKVINTTYKESKTVIPRKTYSRFEREVRLAFKALMEILLAGDWWGKPFNFPKPEVAIEPDFLPENLGGHLSEAEYSEPLKWNNAPSYKELYNLAFKLSVKFGSPYFDNMLPKYRGHSIGGISCVQCCAYCFNIDPTKEQEFNTKMNFANGKHFSMGGAQVVTVNCPRAAYRAVTDPTVDDKIEATISYIKQQMDNAVEIFKVKQQWLKPVIDSGRMPFAVQRPKDPVTRQPGEVAIDPSNLVWIIGVVGMNEVAQVLMGDQLHDSGRAVEVVERVMNAIKLYTYQLTLDHGFKVVLARTPAETVAQRFAVADLLDNRFSGISRNYIKGAITKAEEMIKSGNRNAPIYYTNGCMVPLDQHIPITKKAEIEGRFFPIVDGGNIFHIFTEEVAPFAYHSREIDQGIVDNVMDFGLRLARNTNIGYFKFSPVLSICAECASTTGGDLYKCPKCGSTKIQHWEVITGYLSLRESWNQAKQEESRERNRYNVSTIGG